MEEIIFGGRVGHGRVRVGRLLDLIYTNLTCCDRPAPPRRAPKDLLHYGLALARPAFRRSLGINLQKLCYTGDRWKAHLKEKAQALFSRVEVTLKTADALLILEAGRVAADLSWNHKIEVGNLRPA